MSYRARGTAVYLRDCCQCSVVRERGDIRSADILQLTVKLSDLEHFTLLAVYRLHSGSRADYTRDLESSLDELSGSIVILFLSGILI